MSKIEEVRKAMVEAMKAKDKDTKDTQFHWIYRIDN